MWKQEDVIKESSSPWAAIITLCLRKGGKTRWAMDYRLPNAVTIAHSYPLPRIQENLEGLQGARVFSALDAAGFYHVLPVASLYNPFWVLAIYEIVFWLM